MQMIRVTKKLRMRGTRTCSLSVTCSCIYKKLKRMRSNALTFAACGNRFTGVQNAVVLSFYIYRYMKDIQAISAFL